MKREEWIIEEENARAKEGSGKKECAEEDDCASLTIEETFEELDNLLEMLEQSDSSLEASFRYFERGMKLVRQCSAQIDKVEKQIILLSEEEDIPAEGED